MLENKRIIDDKKFTDRGYIFTNTSGSPLDLNKINNVIKEAIEISSINKSVTTHTLRYTHISTPNQLVINIKAIQ